MLGGVARLRPGKRQLIVAGIYVLVVVSLAAFATLPADPSSLAFLAIALLCMPLSLIGYIAAIVVSYLTGPVDPALNSIIGFVWWSFIGIAQAVLGLWYVGNRQQAPVSGRG